MIAEVRAAGVATLSGIAKALTARGVPTPSGRGAWSSGDGDAAGSPGAGRLKKQEPTGGRGNAPGAQRDWLVFGAIPLLMNSPKFPPIGVGGARNPRWLTLVRISEAARAGGNKLIRTALEGEVDMVDWLHRRVCVDMQFARPHIDPIAGARVTRA